MEHHVTSGNELLEEAGLVAFTRCGHWWVYPIHATTEEMHEVASFSLGIACSFCLAAWQDAIHVRTSSTLRRLN